jgi:hypothetical protein
MIASGKSVVPVQVWLGKGTIYTHTDKLFYVYYRTSKSDSALRALAGSFAPPRTEKTRTASGPPMLSDDMSTPTTEPEVCSKFSMAKFPSLLKICGSRSGNYED